MTITYTTAELERLRDLMDDAITAELLKEMGYNSLREIPHNQKPAFYTEHAKRMTSRGF